MGGGISVGSRLYTSKIIKKKRILLFSWRTKLCQLLCLKYCGRMVLANSVGFFTLNTSPSFDHDIKCCMSSSPTILEGKRGISYLSWGTPCGEKDATALLVQFSHKCRLSAGYDISDGFI